MNAVVVSLIVGNGRPMIVMTAAAMPPEPPAAEAIRPPDVADIAPPTCAAVSREICMVSVEKLG